MSEKWWIMKNNTCAQKVIYVYEKKWKIMNNNKCKKWKLMKKNVRKSEK